MGLNPVRFGARQNGETEPTRRKASVQEVLEVRHAYLNGTPAVLLCERLLGNGVRLPVSTFYHYLKLINADPDRDPAEVLSLMVRKGKPRILKKNTIRKHLIQFLDKWTSVRRLRCRSMYWATYSLSEIVFVLRSGEIPPSVLSRCYDHKKKKYPYFNGSLWWENECIEENRRLRNGKGLSEEARHLIAKGKDRWKELAKMRGQKEPTLDAIPEDERLCGKADEEYVRKCLRGFGYAYSRRTGTWITQS